MAQGPASAIPISPERLAKVDQARHAWIRKLIDLSRRNNLLFFRELKVGTLDLSGGTPLSSLVFSDFGLATWTSDDEGRPPCAPVLLLPVKATQKGSHSDKWSLYRAGDVKVNEVLLHSMQVEHGITITADSLLSEILGDNEGEAFDLGPLFQRLRREAVRVTGFDVQARCVLGNFSFQKLAIVKDLNELLQELARHDIVAGIAGDQTAAELARGSRIDIDPRDFDQSPPDQEFLVRDADASQQQAIAATIGGQSGVISGPPGTGKSQTISNLIAEMAARGKTVLFVAEKRAALDVVLNRLRELDLDHLCLDLHGADVSRRLVAQQLQDSLTRIREATEPAADALHTRFMDAGSAQRTRSPDALATLTFRSDGLSDVRTAAADSKGGDRQHAFRWTGSRMPR